MTTSEPPSSGATPAAHPAARRLGDDDDSMRSSVDDGSDIGPAARAGLTDDPDHAWDEFRVPLSGSPCPEGMADPLAPQLIDTARYFLNSMMGSQWSPARLMRFGQIWQWQKFDLLDWLRPIELLLRRMLLIEAITLIRPLAFPRPERD
jgi:hypothetical protein